MFGWLQAFVEPFVEALGGVFWHDSVRGDRTTIVKIGNEVKVVTFEELFNMFADKSVRIGDREVIFFDKEEVYALTPKSIVRMPEYYMTDLERKAYRMILRGGLSHRAIARAIGTDKGVVKRAMEKARSDNYVVIGGWSRIKYIERHKVGKKMFRVATKYGETVVTEDHSLVIVKNGMLDENKPTNINRENLPAKIHIVDIDEEDSVDMWKYVKEVKWFKLDGDTIRYSRTNFKMPRQLSGKYLEAFMKIVGAYVSEGILTNYKGGYVVILNKDYKWLRDIGETAKKYFGISYTVSFNKKNGVYVLVLNSRPLKKILERLCGRRAKNKKLPDFTLTLKRNYIMVLLENMIKGDGYREKRANRPTSDEFREKYFRYTTISRKLASQLCFILARLGIKYSVWYDTRRSDKRREKVAYTISTVTKYWREGDAKVVIEDVTCGNEYVYDLEVEDSHIFADGIGLILLHNTSMLIIPPTTEPIFAPYVPEPRTKALIIGVTFGTPREYDPSTGTFGPEIESMDVGIWHACSKKMDWHWDPFVKSILMTNPYPQLIWCDASKPYELLIVNNTSTFVAIDATFWIIRFPKRVWCPVLERFCDPEELWNMYMRGIVKYFVRQAVEGKR